MTPADQSERIVRLEANYENLSRQVDSLEKKIDQLLTAADMGKGAWWLILRLGGVLVLLLGALAWVWDRLPGRG